MRALVSSAVRRELREAGAEDAAQFRHRVPLGLLLLSRGWITQAQLQQALQAQRRGDPRPLGQWLIEHFDLEKEYVLRARATQCGCPVLSLEGFEPRSMALTMPAQLMDFTNCLPLRIARDRILYLGSSGTPDPVVALAVQHMSGLKVVSGLLADAEHEYAQQEISTCTGVRVTQLQAADTVSLVKSIASAILAAQPRAARMVRVHRFFWLRMWLESGAMSTPWGGFPVTREDVSDCIFTLDSE